MEWKLLNENPKYEISDAGFFRIVGSDAVFRGFRYQPGYYTMRLADNTLVPVGQLVAKYFVPRTDPTKTDICYKDGNRLNASADNLMWRHRRDRRVSTKIYQYNEEGEILNEYDLQALSKVFPKAANAIKNKSKNRFQYGFYWFSDFEKFDSLRKKKEPDIYDILDMNDNIVYTGKYEDINSYFNLNSMVLKVLINSLCDRVPLVKYRNYYIQIHKDE